MGWGYKFLSILASLAVVLITFLGAMIVILLVSLRIRNGVDECIRLWAMIVNKAGRIRLNVKGAENIPEGPCLFVFNHASLLDISVLFESIPRRIRFGAKKELFYIPIFGWALDILGMLKIDRSNRPRAIKTLRRAVERIHQGEYFILAAEGTRQKKPGIGEFKSGPFVMAIEAGVPVVPIVIEGIHEVLPKNTLLFQIQKPHIVNVEILKPLATNSYTFEQRHELKSLTQTLMVNSFERSRISD